MIKRLILIPILAIFVEGCSKLTSDQIVYLECQISTIETIFLDENKKDRKYKERYTPYIFSINNEDKTAYFYLKNTETLGTTSMDISTFNKEHILLLRNDFNNYEDPKYAPPFPSLAIKIITEINIDRINGDLKMIDYVFSEENNYKKVFFEMISKGKCTKANPPITKF